MELKVKMKLNERTEIEGVFSGTELQEAVRQAGVMLDFDGKCGLCDCTDITPQYRSTKEKGYKYTEYIHRSCGGRRQFGAYRDGGG